MATEKDDGMFAGHLRDLVARSWQNNQYTFTHFLDEAQQSQLMAMEHELSYAGLSLSGGAEHADRVVARFGREEILGFIQPFPIVCLRIDPVAEKFGETISHRDVLGALMNLGIARDLLGDIYVQEKTAYLLCLDHIADYIRENLVRIRHMSVSITALEAIPAGLGPDLEPRMIIAASERLDAVISQVWHMSRAQSQVLFPQGKVFVNGKEASGGSTSCRPGDKVSVRGYGKFIFDGTEGLTGKGRSRICVKIYR